MPLKLSFKPGEKFVINGAVIVNGSRTTQLVLQNKAHILREKDILQQDEATTPARRIYFPVMMLALDPDHAAAHGAEFSLRIAEFEAAISNPEMLQVCRQLKDCVTREDLYKALVLCRRLMAYEADLLEPTREHQG